MECERFEKTQLDHPVWNCRLPWTWLAAGWPLGKNDRYRSLVLGSTRLGKVINWTSVQVHRILTVSTSSGQISLVTGITKEIWCAQHSVNDKDKRKQVCGLSGLIPSSWSRHALSLSLSLTLLIVSCTPLIINYSSTGVSMAIPADRQKMGSHASGWDISWPVGHSGQVCWSLQWGIWSDGPLKGTIVCKPHDERRTLRYDSPPRDSCSVLVVCHCTGGLPLYSVDFEPRIARVQWTQWC